VVQLGVGDELAPIRRAIDEHRPHVAFNLLRSFHDIGVYDAHVISYLELLRMPYTGSNPRGLLLASDKALSKKILSYHRIRVPGFFVFPLGGKFKKPRRVDFPLIVKTVDEHASLGIAQASIVSDQDSLEERVRFMHESFASDVIAEEYIEGRELTIGVLGNDRLTTFPAWELTFSNLPKTSEPIATAKVKWDLEYQKKVGLETGPAELDPKARELLARTAKRIYRALGLSGYARIDVRMDAEARVFVLEANPNPDLCANEDFACSAAAAGVAYPRLVQKILNLGAGYKPAWKVR
jgi:D-alanine-D-alanine ligase